MKEHRAAASAVLERIVQLEVDRAWATRALAAGCAYALHGQELPDKLPAPDLQPSEVPGPQRGHAEKKVP
jgi:hypothetical protein